ncbi:MAG: TonB-dependent receptor [Acidobacteriia bacterium]|nr:TonB-dependent receptor [Terriglobia bacterium]
MRRSELKWWAAVLFAAVLTVGLAGVALAQSDVTNTRITGTVKDADGGALPGAAVEAKSQETGFAMTAVTDGRGFYRILNLPTGIYTVTVNMSGFATEVHPNIRLLLSSPATVDFAMKVAGKAESITVTSEVPLVEVTNTSASTTIQTEQIKQLPVSGRNFMNLVLAMPETTTKNERGYTSLSGQRGINTSFYVDGVDNNNPFFGGVIGQAENRSPLQISQESIKEFSVVTNGASVEMGRSGGGFVNVITKSGTNGFKGSVFYYNQPQSLIATQADGTKPKDQKKSQYGASLGGPIISDKLFFFASYDQQKQDTTQPLAAWLSDPAIAAKYPTLPIAGSNYIQTRDGRLFFGRFDYQFSGSHRLTARANYADYNGQNGTNTSTTDAPGHNGLERMLARSYVAAYSGMFGNSWLNDANAQLVIEDTPRMDLNAAFPEFQVGSGGTTQTGIKYNSGYYGGVSYLPINPTQVQRKSFSDSLTYTLQDHVFKGGVDYNDTSVAQIFKGNWRGVYIFNNEPDFLAGKWSQYRQFAPLNGLTVDQAGLAAFHQKELSFFVQDQWFITPALTASFGVRWEKLDNPNAPVLNLNDRNADGSMKLNGQIPDDTNQWSPRLGLTWSPGSANTTVLRLTAGRFYARTPGILFSQLYTSNALKATQYSINATTDASGNVTGAPASGLYPGWGSAFDPTILAPLDLSHIATPTGLGVFSIASDFQNPYTDRLTLGWDQQLAKDTALGIDFTYAKTYHLERLTDANIQYKLNPDGSIATSPVNGQPVYSSTRPDTYYGRVTTYMSDAQSKYTAVIVTLRRQFTERLFGFAAFTWSQDFDNDSNERNYSGVQTEDFNNISKDWGYSIRDQRWKIALNGVWNTPWWDLSLSGVYRYVTGGPFNPVVSTDVNADGFKNDRPTINGVHLARDSYRYPDYSSLDLRLQKAIKFGPGALAVIVECFNCSNNANWSVPSGGFTWGNGQTPLSTFGVASTATTAVRTYQLALRYDF